MSAGANRKGYRGYICARMDMGRSAPQHIQQLVMRDYCQKNGLTYLLAATEYCMPGCTMILDAVLDELDHLEGIVMYSLGLLPASREKRREMYERLFAKGCTLHIAVEGITIRNAQDAAKLEDVWVVKEAMDAQRQGALEWLRHYDKETMRAGN